MMPAASPAAATTLHTILDRLSDAERPFFLLGEDASPVNAEAIMDDAWFDEQVRLRGLIWGIDDRFTLGTLWWFSASHWLILPTLASMLLTDQVLSPRLADVTLHWRSDSRLPGATSAAVVDGDGVEELGATLDAVIGVLASRLGRGERRLWALAVDSLTNRLLWLGAATGQLGRAQAMAVDLVAALDRPGVPAPRFTTLRDLPEGVRDVWVRRGSCCLVSRVPGHGSCADCPRQTPAEREARLRERALTGGDH